MPMKMISTNLFIIFLLFNSVLFVTANTNHFIDQKVSHVIAKGGPSPGDGHKKVDDRKLAQVEESSPSRGGADQ